MKTGNASYKKNEKKQNNNINNNNTNFQPDLNALQNDPNYLLQQQQYLNQFYLANGYQQNVNPIIYQMYQMMLQQNLNQNQNQNLGNNLQNMGNDNMNNLQQQFQGQDLNQLLGNIAMLQMMSGGGDINAMMGANNENNQDSQ